MYFIDTYILEKTDQVPAYTYTFDKNSKILLKISSVEISSMISFNEDKTSIRDNFGNHFKIEYGSNSFVKKIRQYNENDVLLHVAE